MSKPLSPTSKLPWLRESPSTKLNGVQQTAAKVPGSFLSEAEVVPSSVSVSSRHSLLLPKLARVATTIEQSRTEEKKLDPVIMPSEDLSPHHVAARKPSMIPVAKGSSVNSIRHRRQSRADSVANPPFRLGLPERLLVPKDSLDPATPPMPLKSYERRLSSQEPIDDAIIGLETLIQDAVQVAQEAADHGSPEEARLAFDEAVDTMRKASVVGEHQRMAVPPVHSVVVSDGDVMSSDDYDSEGSSVHARNRCSPGRKVQLQISRTMTIESCRASVHNADSSAGLSDVERGYSSSSPIPTSPAELYGAVEPEAVARDFAFPEETERRRSSTVPTRKASDHLSPAQLQRAMTSAISPLQVDSSDSQQSPQGIHPVRKRKTTFATPAPWAPARHTTMVSPSVPLTERRSHRRLKQAAPSNYGLNKDYYEGSLLESKDYREGPGEFDRPAVVDRTQTLFLGEPKGRPPALPYESRRHRMFHLGHIAKREPIARRWDTVRKRITAFVACFNTGVVGWTVGVYAGMVPGIQYRLADQNHTIIQGNIYLYIGLALTTFFLWPLPLLHGRRPYIIAGLAIAMPLNFPQATIVVSFRSPNTGNEAGLMIARLFLGLFLGLVNINSFTILLDLFGASLMSKRPHQEYVVKEDVRREGGGMGLWLGIWTWTFIASIAIGFLAGAGMIQNGRPEWGFYLTIIVLACVLILNVIAPETRRSSYRRHIVLEREGTLEKAKRKIARGEVRLHISSRGPRY